MTISDTLKNWYKNNARDLPWRNTNDAYLIWLSEIILQQTRVEQGLPYYLAFAKAFPSLQDLSKASEDQVLKLWQGLGYYSRARNMMFTAQQIASHNNGIFPNNYKDILALKGVGPYTAAAIASFAFGLPYAVVDGNVFRILSRYYGVELPINSTKGKKYFEVLAQKVLDIENPATHNQAIMEFGSLLCKPRNPDCNSCPLSNSCVAFNQNKIALLPIKEKKLKIQNRYLHYILLNDGKKIFIEKRDYSGIWKGLYQLPLIETAENITVDNVIPLLMENEILKNQDFELKEVRAMIHKLTHRNLHIRFYWIEIAEIPKANYLSISYSNWRDYAFPQPIHQFLSSIF